MNRLIIVGSPRIDGRSAHLADLLFESCIDECPDDELALAPVSTLAIEPCQGCDACKVLAARAAGGEAAEDGQADEAPRRCVIDDDMAEVYELIDAADELVVVSPVYFAGAPAQLKALLDRLQPYFWTDERHREKRPATLHVVGEGGDPHGFEPLVGVVRSSLSCAGFALERVLDWVGRIDEEGEITAEAVEHPLASLPGRSASAPAASTPLGDAESADDGKDYAPASVSDAPSRPALRLSPEGKSSPAAGNPPAKNASRGKQHASGTASQGTKRPKQGSGKQGSRKPAAGKQGPNKQGPGKQTGRPKQGGKRRG
ncbi:flavodoxin family protein [Gordonibacter urolithinfaciens]|uniref:flavodoxin family protein n=1 Tax=Gordonibacter urolithinfaciens TaxID=1335613 RepID=UPI003A9372E0